MVCDRCGEDRKTNRAAMCRACMRGRHLCPVCQETHPNDERGECSNWTAMTADEQAACSKQADEFGSY